MSTFPPSRNLVCPKYEDMEKTTSQDRRDEINRQLPGPENAGQIQPAAALSVPLLHQSVVTVSCCTYLVFIPTHAINQNQVHVAAIKVSTSSKENEPKRPTLSLQQ